jgi:hypothetical protein
MESATPNWVPIRILEPLPIALTSPSRSGVSDRVMVDLAADRRSLKVLDATT